MQNENGAHSEERPAAVLLPTSNDDPERRSLVVLGR